MKKLSIKGFTIAEVLIASLVFTTILLLCMEGITRIAKVYVKNSTISSTNEFTKSFVEDISQKIRYGAVNPVINTSNTDIILLCVADTGYKIMLNSADTDLPDPGNPIIKIPDTGCAKYSTIANYTTAANSPENVAPRGIRILDMQITPPPAGGSISTISMRVSIGGKDLLIDGNKLSGDAGYNYKTATCRGANAGGEYCAVINITTSVSRRIRI